MKNLILLSIIVFIFGCSPPINNINDLKDVLNKRFLADCQKDNPNVTSVGIGASSKNNIWTLGFGLPKDCENLEALSLLPENRKYSLIISFNSARLPEVINHRDINFLYLNRNLNAKDGKSSKVINISILKGNKYIKNLALTNFPAAIIKELPALEKLEILTLGFDKKTAFDINILKRNPGLKSVLLAKVTKFVNASSHFQKIKELGLANCDDLSILNMVTLDKLNIINCNLDNKSIKLLLNTQKTLKQLVLANCKIKTADVDSLKKLKDTVMIIRDNKNFQKWQNGKLLESKDYKQK